MTEPLESITEKPSLSAELKEQIRNYPKNWKEYMKGLAPALVVSTIGASYGPDAAHALGYDSELSSIVGTYVLGYGGGYSTVFSIEYLRNKEKYGSMFSKEFGKFAYTFFAADYVSDISVFQTTFLASNFLLKEYTQLSDSFRKSASWLTAGMFWISAMAAAHPIAMRVNEYLNGAIKNLYHKIKDKKNKQLST